MNSEKFAVYFIFLDHKSNCFERLLCLLLRKVYCGYNNLLFSSRGKNTVLKTSFAMIPFWVLVLLLVFLGGGGGVSSMVFHALVTHFGDK